MVPGQARILIARMQFIAISLLAALAATGTEIEAKSGDDTMCTKQKLVIQFGKYAFDQFQTKDKFGRTITFYLSESASKEPVPLILFINGSGCASVFQKDSDLVVSKNTVQYNLFLDPIEDRVRLLIVEKPGVKLFFVNEPYGSCKDCSNEFLREYTLERWTEANNAAIRAAQTLPGIEKGKLLVVGHSDGGQIATHVAYTNPDVTHVASIAGGGPTQLFDLAYGSDNGKGTGVNSSAQIEDAYRQWEKIRTDPDSITEFAWGHPYNRWSSFLASSSLDDLSHCKAKPYLVQGTADNCVPVVSFDVLRAELAIHRQDLMIERIEGADHHLNIKDLNGERDERPMVLSRIVNWYLSDQK
jgi:pimeloyl-ACP methyl ester carboxylesterase